MKAPKVSVICLCYNQSRFVREALDAVLHQSYANIEIIIVDDASTDNSQEVIRQWMNDRGEVPFIDLKQNVGNTTAFNQGLHLATGQYVIDLACDDVLCVDRVRTQVNYFERQPKNVGVIYSDVQYIAESGELLPTHFSDSDREAYVGNVFEKLIDTYFIPPPSMMIRKDVFSELNGYDENLAYEDFDFWIRSSRHWDYQYQSDILTKVRKTRHSHSTHYGEKYDLQLKSTVIICRKIHSLINSPGEREALVNRLKYEMRHAFLYGQKEELMAFGDILNELGANSPYYRLLNKLGSLGVRLVWVKYLIGYLRKN